MDFLHQKEYQGNKIMEQIIKQDKLYIITRGDKWRLYLGGKKLCESKDYYKVIERIEK